MLDCTDWNAHLLEMAVAVNERENGPGWFGAAQPIGERITVKRTTNRIMKRSTIGRIFVGMTLAATLAPGVAFAEGDDRSVMAAGTAAVSVDAGEGAEGSSTSPLLLALVQNNVAEQRRVSKASAATNRVATAVKNAAAERTDKVLGYDPADIAAIGNQASSGHSICCPSYSCAYADAVLDGTVHDHSYYTCSCCTWTDWGGGNSSFRCVGTDEELLREAYDQIAAGRPTVVHVRASYGEHWIALIGYQNASDPDHLTLANFIALDPWDGALIVASERFSLYGDGCEHVSSR